MRIFIQLLCLLFVGFIGAWNIQERDETIRRQETTIDAQAAVIQKVSRENQELLAKLGAEQQR